jgi:hypothetical protein
MLGYSGLATISTLRHWENHGSGVGCTGHRDIQQLEMRPEKDFSEALLWLPRSEVLYASNAKDDLKQNLGTKIGEAYPTTL